MSLTLTVSTDGREPQIITFELPRVVIGRGAHADLRLPSRAVSDSHAVLHLDGSEVSIVDDTSSNGTRVNGLGLPHGRRKSLRDGDLLTVGPFTLRVGVVIARGDPPERTASLARRLLLDALAAAGDEVAPPRLVLLTGKEAGAVWTLPPPPSRVVIGREPGCEVILNDNDCSRQHAEVLRDAESVTVRDLGSKNGIVVAGRALSEKRLRHGEDFVIGRTALRYHDPTEELLRALETGTDEALPEAAPALASPLPAPAPSTSSPAPAVPPATPAPVEPVAAAELAEAPSSRGNFDWVVVVLAVVVLVVSVSALVLLLSGRR